MQEQVVPTEVLEKLSTTTQTHGMQQQVQDGKATLLMQHSIQEHIKTLRIALPMEETVDFNSMLTEITPADSEAVAVVEEAALAQLLSEQVAEVIRAAEMDLMIQVQTVELVVAAVHTTQVPINRALRDLAPATVMSRS
jgi:hypothetical protein